MKSVTNLYMFRHGLATHRVGGYGDEIYSAQLLPEGLEQVERLGLYLAGVHSDYNAASEFIRCRQTVDIVSSLSNHQFVFDQRLNEFHNESFSEFTDRVRGFLNEVAEKKYQCVILCTHGAVIAAITSLLTTGGFTEAQQLDYTQPGGLRLISNGKSEDINIS